MAWANRIVGNGEERPDELLANPKNWRIHPQEQTDALSGVLNTVGIVDRVIVNKSTGFVIDGHKRIDLAMAEEQEFIPVEYVDLSEEEEDVILASFDSITEMAGTDNEKLSMLLEKAADSEASQTNERLAAFLNVLKDKTFAGGVTPPEPPDEFREYDEDLETDHECPRCGYQWS